LVRAVCTEEVAARKQTLSDLTNELCHVIVERAKAGKNFGIVLLPEGLIEFVPEVHRLISELNELMAKGNSADVVGEKLTEESRAVFDFLPSAIRHELLLDRDPHGNVQVRLSAVHQSFFEDPHSRHSRHTHTHRCPRSRRKSCLFTWSPRS
jgi:pyrophosphate--fructose-6-phosphate 1-phosphotransferase